MRCTTVPALHYRCSNITLVTFRARSVSFSASILMAYCWYPMLPESVLMLLCTVQTSVGNSSVLERYIYWFLLSVNLFHILPLLSFILSKQLFNKWVQSFDNPRKCDHIVGSTMIVYNMANVVFLLLQSLGTVLYISSWSLVHLHLHLQPYCSCCRCLFQMSAHSLVTIPHKSEARY